MTKVLFFVDRLLRGGIQSFLKTVCAYLPKDKYQASVLTLDDGNDYSELEKEFTDIGVELFKLKGIWLRHYSDYSKYRKALDAFFANHTFDIVHINSGPKNYIVAKYAKKYGIKKVLYHSHNTDYQTNNILKKIYGNILKKKVCKYSTDYLACSYVAGEWMYTKKVLNSNKFQVVHNPVDIKKFVFNQKRREELRKQYKLDDCFVIGNVGRLSKQKNQAFLLEIMAKLVLINPLTKLVIVGIGELENELKEQVMAKHLDDYVLFLGFRNDVNDLLNMFDLIVMPSLFEGFPISLIEAQANGLPCLMSNTITEEAFIKDNCIAMDLSLPPEEWAKCIHEKFTNIKNSRVAPNAIKEYDPEYVISKLQNIHNY